MGKGLVFLRVCLCSLTGSRDGGINILQVFLLPRRTCSTKVNSFPPALQTVLVVKVLSHHKAAHGLPKLIWDRPIVLPNGLLRSHSSCSTLSQYGLIGISSLLLLELISILYFLCPLQVLGIAITIGTMDVMKKATSVCVDNSPPGSDNFTSQPLSSLKCPRHIDGSGMTQQQSRSSTLGTGHPDTPVFT